MPRSDVLTPGSLEQSANDSSSLDNFTTDVVVADNVDDAITESEQDAEEEIDQLDSDSDVPPEQPPADVPAPKKISQARSGERRPGQTLLPAVRVENILQAEGLLGNLNLSKEGVFLLSVATEEFIRHFVKLGHGRSQYYNRNMVRYDDMAAVVQNRYDFNFLRDTIPTPRTLHSAFAARKKREKELLRDDPALQFKSDFVRPSRLPSPKPLLANGRNIMVVDSPSGPDSASSSRAKPIPCPRPTSRKQASKATAPTPPHGAPSSSTGKRPITGPTETWEEWKEKSRRLYGTSDGSKQKITQSSSNLSNEGPSTQGLLVPQHEYLDHSREEKPQHLNQSSSGDVDLGYPNRNNSYPSHAEDSSGVHRSQIISQTSSDVEDLSETESRTRPSDITSTSSTRYGEGAVHQSVMHPPKPPSWRAPLTGPGSAFLQGPGGPFPAPPPTATPSHPASNSRSSSSSSALPPGRTIYSPDSHATERVVD